MKKRVLALVLAASLLLVASTAVMASGVFNLGTNLYLQEDNGVLDWWINVRVPGVETWMKVGPACPNTLQGVQDLLNSPDSGWKNQILASCQISAAPIPAPVVVPPAPPAPPAPAPACTVDNQELVASATPADRAPIGESFRWTINEVSWVGSGFAGLDRAIVVLPPLGSSQVISLNTTTRRVIAFCGNRDQVAALAVNANVAGLSAASRRASDGAMPDLGEIPVVIFDLSGFDVKKAGGPSLGTIASHLQVIR